MKLVLALWVGYFLGAVPTAYIFGRVYKGIDIRKHGSGNVGATNVFRVLGKWPGTIVLVLDILKRVLAVTLVGDIFSDRGGFGDTSAFAVGERHLAADDYLDGGFRGRLYPQREQNYQ